ncbi:DNA-binding response regulator [Parageobacillus thermoglucosidasius]|jgi:DNA-binding LytR/AlgR family response regulator|uniref:LytR/AlgR family response regulator transcription factor n=1 Tax=Parageobacillus thermoglucosidasius TaxID=1426 RepID=UPI000F624EB0|nr:LytTR family DNA-binding domain-containing protein [Parageobacillus thermoglucosidasius]GCD84106.1 DNA-binding response regulator [Parageobacillus thermoglucosidasius]
MMHYTVIVVEDDVDFRKYLVNLLTKNGFNVIGEASTGMEAKTLAQRLEPQIIFFDISLPDVNGMSIAKQLHIQLPSIGIVFITGYTEFASLAFDIEAIDYLVKPFTEERFYLCLKKVSKFLREGYFKQPSLYLGVKNQRGIDLIEQNKIMFVTFEGKVTKIYFFDGKVKMLTTTEALKAVEKKLNPSIFIRTHRSFIVNIKYISRIETSGQTHIIYFKYGTEIAYLSKNYLLNLYERLQVK